MAKTSLAKLLGLADDQEGLRFWEIIAIASWLIGTTMIAIFSAALGQDGLRTFGILALVAGASWGAGSVLGFLFGVPRLRSQTGHQTLTGEQSQFTPNTNLEQISDWLTKIIVGATLVQLDAVLRRLQDTAVFIGESVGSRGAAPVGGAVMIYFFTAGFMWGYLWCSVRIFREMIRLARETDGEDESIPELPPIASKPARPKA
ncbi:MAG: hypothetical protein JF588_00535 [Caulobacterales bacterium]|nr:hypothetical protein [Caulobacterales bacterium]